MPPDAVARQTDDLDGDGRPDTVWLDRVDGSTRLGVTTASGATASVPWQSGSPVQRAVLVADVDDDGLYELLRSDGRSVELWAYRDCTLVPLRNPEGQTYTFSLGFTDVGTGVGCVADADGTGRHLVGIDRESAFDPDGPVRWRRTTVTITGRTAANGEVTSGSYDRTADAAAIEALNQVTCLDRTLTADGLALPEP